jgi:hypothetical protein
MCLSHMYMKIAADLFMKYYCMKEVIFMLLACRRELILAIDD